MDMDVFWDLCTRLESLTIYGWVAEEVPNESVTFRRLLDLSVHFIPLGSGHFPLRWVRHCPNLTTVRLSHQLTSNYELNASYFPADTLSVLKLRTVTMTDTQLAQVIGSMHQATRIEVTECDFGEQAFNSLRRHFSTLKELEIGERRTPTSAMATEILASCPHLVRLSTGRIMSGHVIDSAPWVCAHSLKHLRASFRIRLVHLDEHHRHVLGRISEQVNLTHLELTSDDYSDNSAPLDLQLEKGLDRLVTLQRLYRLVFAKHSQRLSKPDVKWMIDNWRGLRSVDGILNANNNSELVKLFDGAGILYAPDGHPTVFL